MTEEIQGTCFNLFKYFYDAINTPIGIWRVGEMNTQI